MKRKKAVVLCAMDQKKNLRGYVLIMTTKQGRLGGCFAQTVIEG
jgi:hypothetical protein